MKMKNFDPSRIVRKQKCMPSVEGNFHRTFLTKILNPEYIKNSYNAIRKRQFHF